MSAVGGPSSGRRPARLVVVGGGITGLAAAHRAVERTRPGEVEVILLEAQDRLGGVITTQRRDGFLVEGGPDSFISEKPAAIELCKRLGLGGRLIPTNDRFRRTLVVRDGRLIPLPDGFQLLGPTRFLPFLLSPVLSLRGKLVAAKDLVLPRGGPPPGGDESLAHFVRRRLGNEVLERLAQPLVGGIYIADPETLSLASTMPRFLELERRYRSVILGLRAQAKAAGAASGTSGARFGLFVTLADGLTSMVEAIVERLPPGAVRTGMAVRALEPASTDVTASAERPAWRVVPETGAAIEADAVVVALPAHAAARLLAPLDAQLADALGGIAYASSAVVSLAYRRDQVPRVPDAFGFVVPAIEGRRIIAGSFSSVKYAGRAPEDSVLMRLFVGGALQPELFQLGDDEIMRIVREEIRDLLGITSEPSLTWVQRWPQSMPQYAVGHAQRVATIEARAAQLRGLALAGNAYHGVGLADCVASGEAATDRLLASLAGRATAGAAA